jgi:hypothetical protein
MGAAQKDRLDGFFNDGDEGSLESETPAADEAEAAAEDSSTKTDNGADAETTSDTSDADSQTANSDSENLDDSDPHPVPRKVLIEERTKRQEAQRRAAAIEEENRKLREQINPQRQTTNEQTAEQRRAAADEQFLTGSPTELIEKTVREALDNQRYATSFEDAKEKFGDELQSYLGAFAKRVSEERQKYRGFSPLAQEMHDHRHPSVFAAEQGRKLLESPKDVTNLDEWREKERAKIRAEEREAARKEKALATAKDIPQSTAGTRDASAAADDGGDTDGEDEDFKTVLGRRRR